MQLNLHKLVAKLHINAVELFPSSAIIVLKRFSNHITLPLLLPDDEPSKFHIFHLVSRQFLSKTEN